jgi:hypothetical protein
MVLASRAICILNFLIAHMELSYKFYLEHGSHTIMPFAENTTHVVNSSEHVVNRQNKIKK